ncbi:hypothetical protein [Methylobacterium sp. WSM2598]|uniref:hypothetical protein n=1 Tax=Methylobacterium sp. WSM2598 TaxID=398261 RepID=UPI0012F68D1F|nr:hypothetical protein [Methylobacterium sp. WSM2598]
MLINKLSESLISSIFGGMTGIGSSGAAGAGLFSFIPKLFGFSEGGFTGNGGKYEPAGIVHRGEFVIPADVVKRIGPKYLEALREGYAEGGLVGISTPSIPSARTGGAAAGTTITVAPQITVQAMGNGTPDQHATSPGR